MTQMSQDIEYNVLGCKVRVRSDQNDSSSAQAVIDFINAEIQQMKLNRPQLKDTDVAVLVALKVATEKVKLEEEYKQNIFKLEESLAAALKILNVEAN